MDNIPVLMYHSINNSPQHSPLGFLSFSSSQFKTHLRYLKKNGFECITLDELYQRAIEGKIGNPKLAVITFDDGFLDNLTIAQPILEEFGFKATIFVNPDLVDDIKPDRKENHTHWGQLSYPELIEMEKRGIISIQSHTMTHDFLFSNDRVIDFYSPQKYNKYYWLGNILFPKDKPYWLEKIQEHKIKIPEGYPIFNYGRALTTRKFTPDEAFIQKCIYEFSKAGSNRIELANQYNGNKGIFESDQEYKNRVKQNLELSKKLLEEKLNKNILAVCFPGGSYNNYILSCAELCGYKLFMLSSRDSSSYNNKEMLRFVGQNNMIGIKRISITKNYPTCLHNSFTDYLNCKYKIESFMGIKRSLFFYSFLRLVRKCISIKNYRYTLV